jgi:hypothetical protein
MCEGKVKQMYACVLTNKSTCRGQYYEEDDWSVIVYAESMDKLVDVAAKEYGSRGGGFECDVFSFDVIDMKGNLYLPLNIVKDEIPHFNRYDTILPVLSNGNKLLSKDVNNFEYKVQNSDICKSELVEYTNRIKKQEETSRDRYLKEEKIKDLKILEALKSKYEK